jgi:ATP-dependent helicase HrpB
VLDEGSAATGSELLVAVSLRSGRRSARADHLIGIAHPVELEQLEPRIELELRFDEEHDSVVQRQVGRWQELRLFEKPGTSAPDPVAAAALLAEAAAAAPERALDPSDEEAQLLARVRFLAAVVPELELPGITSWTELLAELCAGRRSFAELRRAELSPALLARLSWSQRQALGHHAPERIRVPSGSRMKVDYDVEGPPVLAARIQQLFGWSETPRIARGRAPILLHLLAPNGRPAQVTADLAGFWASSYALVRKDLRGRYPKHSWPEDPATATPEDRPRRKR